MDKGFSESEPPPPPPAKGSWEGWVAIGVLSLAAVIVAFLFGIFEKQKSQGSGASHRAVGSKIETIDLEPLEKDDKPFTLADLKGKVTLINFWGPWCPPCLQEFPELVHMVNHHSDDPDFQMIFVSCSGQGKETAPEHLSSTRELLVAKGYKVRVFIDPTQQTLEGVRKISMQPGFYFPTTVMIGPEGKITGMWVGYESYYVQEMHDMVHQALHELEAKKS